MDHFPQQNFHFCITKNMPCPLLKPPLNPLLTPSTNPHPISKTINSIKARPKTAISISFHTIQYTHTHGLNALFGAKFGTKIVSDQISNFLLATWIIQFTKSKCLYVKGSPFFSGKKKKNIKSSGHTCKLVIKMKFDNNNKKKKNTSVQLSKWKMHAFKQTFVPVIWRSKHPIRSNVELHFFFCTKCLFYFHTNNIKWTLHMFATSICSSNVTVSTVTEHQLGSYWGTLWSKSILIDKFSEIHFSGISKFLVTIFNVCCHY